MVHKVKIRKTRPAAWQTLLSNMANTKKEENFIETWLAEYLQFPGNFDKKPLLLHGRHHWVNHILWGFLRSQFPQVGLASNLSSGYRGNPNGLIVHSHPLESQLGGITELTMMVGHPHLKSKKYLSLNAAHWLLLDDGETLSMSRKESPRLCIAGRWARIVTKPS